VGRPANQSVLRTAAQVERETAERALGNVAGRNPGPVLQPERSRQGGKLGIKREGCFPGIDRAGGLTHDRSAIEISGIAEQSGASLGQAVDDGPVDRCRPGKRRQQAPVESIYAERERREELLAQDLGDTGTEDSIDSGGTEGTHCGRRLEGLDLGDRESTELVGPGHAGGGTTQCLVGEREDDPGFPPEAKELAKDVLSFENASEIGKRAGGDRCRTQVDEWESR
jgi:hypothetical protein